MPDKYHISPVTGKAAVCSAEKRACRYGNSTHYVTLTEAEQAATVEELTTSISRKLSPKQKPIIVEPNVLSEPNVNVDLHYCGGLDIAYDAYGHPFGVECSADEDDYCRDEEYENLRMEKNDNIDIRKVLKTVFTVKPEQVSDELINFAESIGMDSSDAYEAVVAGGYYGEEADIRLSSATKKALYDWYFTQNNANDKYGILDYCRSKGTVTAGLTPLEAIKHQLKTENKKVHPKVDSAIEVETHDLNLGLIKVGNLTHYSTAEPHKPESFTGGKAIIGVIIAPKPYYGYMYRHNPVSEAVLVDGYHRYKFAKTKGQNKGKFIVLYTKP